MQNLINGLSSFVNIIKSIFGIFSMFIPAWIVILIMAFIGLAFLLVALKVIGSILDALPFV